MFTLGVFIYILFKEHSKQITMKKILILFIALTASAFTNPFTQKQSITDLLCSGKWHIDYAVYDGEKREISEERKKSTWLLFYKDGKHDAMSPNGLHKGTWELDNDKQHIKFIENSNNTHNKDDVVIQKILTLNATQMALETVMEHKKISIHFKKMN